MLRNWYLERLRAELIGLTRLRKDYRRVVDTFDFDAVDRIREESRRTDPSVTYTKYLDFEEYIPVSLKRAYGLGLHKAQPSRILDIGTGTGYFPLVCKSFGHEAAAMDLDVYTVFNDVIRVLGVDRTVAGVSAYEPLPQFEQKFDLLTAFRVAFKKQKDDRGETWYWREKEWDFFLRDAATNVLTERSRMFLDMNPEQDGSHYTEDLRRYFERHGATVAGRLIYFESMDAFR